MGNIFENDIVLSIILLSVILKPVKSIFVYAIPLFVKLRLLLFTHAKAYLLFVIDPLTYLFPVMLLSAIASTPIDKFVIFELSILIILEPLIELSAYLAPVIKLSGYHN